MTVWHCERCAGVLGDFPDDAELIPDLCQDCADETTRRLNSSVTVYQPVCTCAVEGIYGCTMHTFPPTDEQHGWQTIEDLARLIAAGVQAYGDADAQRLARAYLEERT